MSTKRIKVHRIQLDQESIIERKDTIASDQAVCIFVNNDYYRALIATPTMIEELVVGHLIGEGVIESLDDLKEIEVEPLKVRVKLHENVDFDYLNMSKINLITTACGSQSTPIYSNQLEALKITSEIIVKAEMIWDMIRELNLRSEIYKETGGTHSAMLSKFNGEVISFAEDVGRHNAVDKVIGTGVLKGVELGECVLLSSGRQSSEIVLKVARSGIPIIASVAGPLESGINIANSTGITLICFVRGRRMNVYTHHNRIS